MSLPCHQPEKWKGMKAVSGATRGVTSALTLIRAPVGVETTTYSPSRMPRSAAAFGLISTKLSCCSSASHGFERVSSPPPSKSTSHPDVRMIGNFSYSLVSMFNNKTKKNNKNKHQKKNKTTNNKKKTAG